MNTLYLTQGQYLTLCSGTRITGDLLTGKIWKQQLTPYQRHTARRTRQYTSQDSWHSSSDSNYTLVRPAGVVAKTQIICLVNITPWTDLPGANEVKEKVKLQIVSELNRQSIPVTSNLQHPPICLIKHPKMQDYSLHTSWFLFFFPR